MLVRVQGYEAVKSLAVVNTAEQFSNWLLVSGPYDQKSQLIVVIGHGCSGFSLRGTPFPH